MNSAFVSYAWPERDQKEQLVRWGQSGLVGDWVFMGERDDVRVDGAAAIKAHLRTRMQGAAALVVLVGNISHDRPWIDYEVNHALSERMPVVVVRVKGTTGAAPRAVRGFAETIMDPSSIRVALDR